MKRFLIIFAGLSAITALAVGFATSGTAATRSSAKSPSLTVRIQHQTKGCHSWSVNGNLSRATRSVHAARGVTITFVDNDIMSHRLIQTSGPGLQVIGNRAMTRMGASVKVLLMKAGTYRFTTKAGEDYKSMAGMKTTGEDNVLHLTVAVS